jgi:hypothetical protein
MNDTGRGRAGESPRVAAVIVTTDRRTGAVRAALSVVESTGGAVEICVVHQGEALPPDLVRLGDVEGVTVVNVPPHGLAAARNVGVRLTRAPIVAFTDDDCVVRPGWLEAIAAPFAADPGVGVVFGSVGAADYDRTAGFIQAYEVTRARTVRGVARQWQVGGIGACMAVRRSTFDALHGFDERLGAGTPLCAAEDCDIVIRALVAGYAVHETPAAVVTHLGFHSWRQGPAVIAGYMRGVGASQAKMLRLAKARAIGPMLALGWRWLAQGPLVDLNHRPPRLGRLAAFLSGLREGWLMPIDRATGWFAPVRAAAPPIVDKAPSRLPTVRST